MATTQRTRLLIWVTALALVMACVPSLTAQSIPTVDPGAINTLIIQTANAAATQTAAGLPSSTSTPILTPTRNTETPSPTATSTVIFIFFSPTPLIVPTSTIMVSGGFACQILRTSPAKGSKFFPREDFDASWLVKNVGKKKWDRASVDYTYSEGAKIHKISSYDLDKNVPIGGELELPVNMQAPKDPGTYTTTWIMSSGNKVFCPLTLNIVVRAPEATPQETTQTTTATP